MTEFALDGLDAANPLGMLAALGTLRISTLLGHSRACTGSKPGTAGAPG